MFLIRVISSRLNRSKQGSKKKCFWRRFKEERKKGMRGILLCVVIPWTNPSLVVRDDLSWAEHCTQMGGTFFVHLSPHNWTQLATGVSFFQSWALVRRLTSCWERLSLLLFSYSLYFRRVYSTGYAQWVHVCVCVTFDQLSTAHSPYTHTHPSTVDHPLSHSDGRFFYNKLSQRTRTSWRSVGRSPLHHTPLPLRLTASCINHFPAKKIERVFNREQEALF